MKTAVFGAYVTASWPLPTDDGEDTPRREMDGRSVMFCLKHPDGARALPSRFLLMQPNASCLRSVKGA
jgi:hypothetical protein